LTVRIILCLSQGRTVPATEKHEVRVQHMMN
jgi:hypothetical protein